MDQSKYFPKEEKYLPNRGEIWGEAKGKIMDLGGGQADIGWW